MAWNECGALWLKTTRNGDRYMSGKITIGGIDRKISVFENKRRESGSNTPDFRINALDTSNGDDVYSSDKRAAANEQPETPGFDDSDLPF